MPYVFRQGDLPKLDLQVDHGTDFKAWKSQWEAYFSLSGLDGQPGAKQVQALTLCLSCETVTIVDNLGLTAEQRGSVKEIIAAIEHYVHGQINETVERRNFRRSVQQEGETFDDFLVSLRELAKTCNFCSDTCTQKNILDQTIEGLLDGDIVEDLLKEKDLSLQSTVAKCRAHEAAKRQRAEIVSGPADTAVQTLRKLRPNTKHSKQTCPGCFTREAADNALPSTLSTTRATKPATLRRFVNHARHTPRRHPAQTTETQQPRRYQLHLALPLQSSPHGSMTQSKSNQPLLLRYTSQLSTAQPP